MTDRTITLSAAEVPVVRAAIESGEPVWLVRDADLCTDRRHYILRPSPHNRLGTRRNDVHDDIRCANPCGNAADGARRLLHQVPVEFVLASALCETCGDTRDSWRDYWSQDAEPCPDCRIELVAVSSLAARHLGYNVQPRTLGYGYAIGQPSLIDMVLDVRGVVVADEDAATEVIIPLHDLAHCGPPETLPGKWAQQFQVVGS